MFCQQAFLESYLTPGPTLQYSSECWQALQWTLVSEASVTSPLRHGTEFQLKNSHFCLVVSSKAIPQLRISEEYVHPKSHKFVLQVQSETSVWPSAVSVAFIHNKLRNSVSFCPLFFRNHVSHIGHILIRSSVFLFEMKSIYVQDRHLYLQVGECVFLCVGACAVQCLRNKGCCLWREGSSRSIKPELWSLGSVVLHVM